MDLSYDFTWLRAICWADDTEVFEDIDDTSSSTITELQMALEHRSATLSIRSYEFDRFIDDLRVFLESAIFTRITSSTSFQIPTISLDDRVIIDILEHGRIDRPLDMIHDAFDLFCLDEDSLKAGCRHRTRRKIEHIATTEEILCPDLIEDRTRVDIRGDGKGYSRWDIRLDETSDDID